MSQPTYPPPYLAPHPTAPQKRRWPVVVGAATATAVIAGGAVGAWLLLRDDDAATGARPGLPRPVAADASEAWAASIDSEWGLRDATAVGEVVVISEGWTIDEGTRVRGFDGDGEELWSYDDLYGGAEVYGLGDDRVLVCDFHAPVVLSATDGEEVWRGDADEHGCDTGDIVGGALAAEHHHDPSTVLYDLETGEHLGDGVDGALVAEGTPGFVLADEGQVTLVDSEGDEQWSAEVDWEDSQTGYETRNSDAAVTEDLVVLLEAATDGETPRRLIALDARTGEELWTETGWFEAPVAGPDGTVAVIRREGENEDGAPSVVTYDGDGEVAAAPHDVSDLATVAVPGGATYLYDPDTDRVFDADLEEVPVEGIEGLTTDGVYRLDGATLELRAWEDGEVLLSLDLGSSPDEIEPVDGGVVVQTGASLRLYR